MKHFLRFILLLLIAHASAFAGERADRYWRAADVRVGMKGTGRTVLKGNEIREFQCEVIGVLKKVFPKEDVFLARLSGLGLEETGIIEGMSGSPVYVDGKLLGAVAYGWSFSKQPIAGITPAEYMYNLVAEAGKPNAQAPPRKPQNFRPLGRSGAPAAPNDNEIPASRPAKKNTMAFRRLRAPLVVSGCPQPVFDHYAGRFERMGLLPVQGGGAGVIAPAEAGAEAAKLIPGAPVAVSLIDGDMSMAGIGTVTDRVGDHIIAFGHPMMEMGRVELPLATAHIDAVIPNLWSSFKLSTVRRTVGTLLVDRSEGIYGRVGKMPNMLPVSVKVDREDFPGETVYSYRVAQARELTPYLVNISLSSSVFMKGSPPLEYTIQYTVRVVTDKGDVIQLEDMASSSSWWPMWSFFDAVSGTVGRLMNNPFEEVRIKEVEADMEIKLGDRAALIDSVRLLDVKAAPGESARALVELRRYRRPPVAVELEIPVPADLPEGVYSVMIADAESARQAAANIAPSEFDPKNYKELLKLLRLQYPSNEIYALISVPHTGLRVGGTPLRNLPASYLSMLTPVGRSKNELIGRLVQTSQRTEYQIIGSQSVQLLVEKED